MKTLILLAVALVALAFLGGCETYVDADKTPDTVVVHDNKPDTVINNPPPADPKVVVNNPPVEPQK